jgi:membrane protease YdiL (CAAX protease family)
LGDDFRRALALRGLDWTHVSCVLSLVPVLVIVNSTVISWLNSAYQEVGLPDFRLPFEYLEERLKSIRELPTPLAAAVIVVCLGVGPGVWEEFFYRGFLGRGLIARWGVFGGVVLTSILFGAVHITPVWFIFAAAMGALLHVVYLWSRSLLAPVLLHAGNNSLFFLGYCFPANSLAATLTNPDSRPWPLVLTAFASLVALFWLYCNMRVQWILPSGSLWTPGYVTAEMPPNELQARPEQRRAGKWPLSIAAAAYLAFIGVFVWEVLSKTTARR